MAMADWITAWRDGVGAGLVVELLKSAYGWIRKRPDAAQGIVALAASQTGISLNIDNAARWWARREVREAILLGDPTVLATRLYDIIPVGTSPTACDTVASSILNNLQELDFVTFACTMIVEKLARIELRQDSDTEVLDAVAGGVDAALYDLEEIKELLAGVTLASEHSRDPSRPRIIMSPPRCPVWFTGRSNELKEITELLLADDAVSVVALVGAPGIGKSAIAAAYTRSVAEKYEQIAWLDCSESVEAGLNALRKEVKPQSTRARSAATELFETQGSTLLVLDGVVGAEELEGVLPSVGRGAVLITTQDRAVAPMATIIDVGPLTSADALAFLTTACGRTDVNQNANRLIAATAGSPLLLTLAASSARVYGSSFLELASELETPSSGEPKRDPTSTNAARLRLSVESSLRRATEASEHARVVLNMVAVVGAEGLPQGLVRVVFPVDDLGEVPTRREVIERILGDAGSRAAIAALVRYSLVSADGRRRLTLHAAVGSMLRDDLASSDRLLKHLQAVAISIALRLELEESVSPGGLRSESQPFASEMALALNSVMKVLYRVEKVVNSSALQSTARVVFHPVRRVFIYFTRHLLLTASHHHFAHFICRLGVWAENDHWRDIGVAYHWYSIVRMGDPSLGVPSEANLVEVAGTEFEKHCVAIERLIDHSCDHPEVVDMLSETVAVLGNILDEPEMAIEVSVVILRYIATHPETAPQAFFSIIALQGVFMSRPRLVERFFERLDTQMIEEHRIRIDEIVRKWLDQLNEAVSPFLDVRELTVADVRGLVRRSGTSLDIPDESDDDDVVGVFVTADSNWDGLIAHLRERYPKDLRVAMLYAQTGLVLVANAGDAAGALGLFEKHPDLLAVPPIVTMMPNLLLIRAELSITLERPVWASLDLLDMAASSVSVLLSARSPLNKGLEHRISAARSVLDPQLRLPGV